MAIVQITNDRCKSKRDRILFVEGALSQAEEAYRVAFKASDEAEGRLNAARERRDALVGQLRTLGALGPKHREQD